MYNRYIPQGDGSFRRDWIPDAPPPCPPKQEPSKKPTSPPQHPPHKPSQPPPSPPSGVGGFLKQLIPKDFCTEDLLIVLLLLLMSGDCKEDQNFALLTLALYLFL